MTVSDKEFETVFKDDFFEIRDYHASPIAEVTLAGDRQETADLAFRILTRYQSGANECRQRLARTSPAMQVRSQGNTHGTIAPVVQSDRVGAWTLRFRIEPVQTHASLPLPDDRRVFLGEVPASRYAVLRFSGFAAPREIKAQTAALTLLVMARRELALGPEWIARDPSVWTPGFLRRNEVLLPLRVAEELRYERVPALAPAAGWVLVPSPSLAQVSQETTLP